MSQPIALITGTTSGIGEATARLLSEKYRLIICGRRKDRLEKLQNELVGEVQILCFDVRDKEAVFASIESLPTDWKKIDVLINNAGNAHGLDFIHEGSTEDWDAMMDINVKGLLYVSKAIIPQMVERKKGHIVNVSSIAGLEVYQRGNVYCASKHAVDALTKGMRMDLNEHGIKVTSIDPGLVETEFSEVRFKGDSDRASQVYQNFTPLTAHDVAETIEFTLNRPPHVMIGDLLILPTDQATSTIVNKKSK
ncbi:NADP-dependent 3-hydroxy acid dehydrogenase YdfG [Ekhidna lutea]|uniref:NADP-dependent 3-hydroxy acid dehydrogenase YdfG n=1 Tax=Ekhidna lutea TaxID=447679 RepID=A0A239JKV4_EKHLU|nr:SDR family NAD(P)-dependent oxidoreductase [Ekhidna lutea]SNT06511.1 NADP-dependent 3-hydroxy acid dehydrogenase YdfG [Ekhidna lutea]